MDLEFPRLLNIEPCWPLLSDQWPAIQTAFSVLCTRMVCCLLTVLLSVPENTSSFFLIHPSAKLLASAWWVSL